MSGLREYACFILSGTSVGLGLGFVVAVIAAWLEPVPLRAAFGPGFTPHVMLVVWFGLLGVGVGYLVGHSAMDS